MMNVMWFAVVRVICGEHRRADFADRVDWTCQCVSCCAARYQILQAEGPKALAVCCARQ